MCSLAKKTQKNTTDDILQHLLTFWYVVEVSKEENGRQKHLYLKYAKFGDLHLNLLSTHFTVFTDLFLAPVLSHH